ncbi:MAG: peptidylprolyl isomerase [Bacteroidia bacterium]|nr:peptidylprolyl isomerase [Bacteroidia bacterium]
MHSKRLLLTKIFNKTFSFIRLTIVCSFILSQNLLGQTADKIIAIIDDDIILESELQSQYQYFIKNGQTDDGTLMCSVFENLLISKLLLSKARMDSLKVSADQIENELNRRIAMFVHQFGSEEELEKFNKKSMIEFRLELRPKIREQLLIDQMKSKITEGVAVTPKEIRDFFNSQPKDSLPYLPAEVEISHILIKLKPSIAKVQETIDQLKEIRSQIVLGKMRFEEMATYYSEDPGSKREGGMLGEFGRGQMVPEFEDIAYNLHEGEISEPFSTAFGYHIIKLHKKIGDRVVASHILIKPRLDEEAEERAIAKLDSIRKLILQDSLTFENAASRFSDDRVSKDNGGFLTNTAGETKIPIDQLDADLYLKIDKLKIKELSEPLEYYYQENGESVKAYHIVKLRAKYPPHRANLKDDYTKFQQAALQAKQAAELEKWFQTAKQQVFIEIKDGPCKQALQGWY